MKKSFSDSYSVFLMLFLQRYKWLSEHTLLDPETITLKNTVLNKLYQNISFSRKPKHFHVKSCMLFGHKDINYGNNFLHFYQTTTNTAKTHLLLFPEIIFLIITIITCYRVKAFITHQMLLLLWKEESHTLSLFLWLAGQQCCHQPDKRPPWREQWGSISYRSPCLLHLSRAYDRQMDVSAV